jgi:MFS family permease
LQVEGRHAVNLLKITVADFIVRTGYQMGKTPLLPLFAASLGAGDALLGVIVSVSTLTGMLLKPLVGVLSDRWGRRVWLLGGAGLFAGIPFLYQFIQSPESLLALRLVHGLATAIFGPVTLALVAEQATKGSAEKLGWFGMARIGGYLLGPLLAAGLLTLMPPVEVFTLIGALSCLAFAPLLLLNFQKTQPSKHPPIHTQIVQALQAGMRCPELWVAGGLETVVYLALYALKAFLPLYALAKGVDIVTVGAFFSLQELTHLLCRPLGGRLGDRWGYLPVIACGMLLGALALALLPGSEGAVGLLALAVLIGLAQALIFPTTLALFGSRIPPQHLGAGMGLIGTMKNTGKVIGPVLGGLLVHWQDFSWMLWTMAGLLVLGAVGIWQFVPRHALLSQDLFPEGSGD